MSGRAQSRPNFKPLAKLRLLLSMKIYFHFSNARGDINY
jgi:hypothetical protein